MARDLGISPLTVHRALTSSGYVSKELRERIEVRARELGYIPNRSARALKNKQRFLIALFSTREPTFVWRELATGVSIARKQVAGFGIKVQYHQVPFADTNAYVRSLSRTVAAGVNAIALVNNHEYDMERIFSFIEERGIPFITMNIDAPETDRMCFVGPDYREAGVIAAELFDKILPAGAEVVAFVHRFPEIAHLPSARITEQSLAGLADRLKTGVSGLSLRVERIEHDADEARIRGYVKTCLGAFDTRLKGVYCGATIQDSVGQVIQELGLSTNTKVIANDLTPATARYLENGAFVVALTNNPTLQGYFAVKVLEDFLETGRRPERDLHIAHNIIVKSNIGVRNNYNPLMAMEY